MKISFDLKERAKKIENLSEQEQLKVIYMWVKQGVINLPEFKFLLSPILESEKNGRDWFNNFQEVDSFVFNQLNVDDVITSNTSPAQNTIANIKQLIEKAKC